MTRLIDPFTLYPAAEPPPGDSTLNNGLLSYWALENLNDAVGSRNLTNLNNVQFVAGHVNNASSNELDGYARLITAVDPVEFRLTGDRTICFWMKPTAYYLSNNQYIFGYQNHYRFRTFSGTWYMYIYTGSWSFFAFHSVVADVWQCVQYTYNSATNEHRGRIDKQAWNSATLVPDTSSTGEPLAIHADGQATFNPGLCLMDEVAIYDRILFNAEADEYVDQGNAGNTYPFPGLP